tara:strand:- start:212 stop:823 length:612 start_codon:yes stop_codon:yes gene_type:complete
MGDKSASNVINELSKTRVLNLAKFLHALGMERIGPEVATTIARHFTSLDNLLHWIDEGEYDELTIIDGIGEKVAAIFREGILKRRILINQLTQIITIVDEPKSSKGVLTGKSFCITGSLSSPRKEISIAIKSVGGKVVNSVSANLDYLVVGESAGSKLEKANSLGIPVLSESDLYSLIKYNTIKSSSEGGQENSDTQMSLGDY